MSHTNSTTNYGLPQWIGTDKPTFLGDFNSAFSAIDTGMKNNADAATSAVNTANTASTAATTASTNATTALNTANSAATDAATAVATAGAADTKATQALAAASTAETAAAANTITNLAPAYDSTLTYAVGDLVTYVDEQGSGKLYKNIVPIAVPEEFNINKWDDVTTSEAYSRASKVVASHTKVSGETNSDVYSALFAEIGSFDINKEYLLVELSSGGFKSIKHTRQVGSNTAIFTDFRLESARMFFDSIVIKSAATSRVAICDYGGAPNSNDTSASEYGYVSCQLIELSTE